MGVSSKVAGRTIATSTIIIIILLLILILLFGAVSIWALFFRDNSPVVDEGPGILAPDYAPMDTDTNATDIENDSTDKLDAPEGGSAVGMNWSPNVVVDLSEKTIVLMFQNPGRSLNNMVLQIAVQDTLLAQSDLLIPGKMLTKMPLKEEAISQLQVGGYNGKFIASFYNPNTGEKNMVDSEIAVTITVVE